jgi:aldose 1-epimerase
MPTPQSWTLRAASGLECHVLSYGAVLQRLRVPVGPELRDVVLGLPTEADYVQSMTHPYPPFYGAIVGPHAGRIAHGQWPESDIRLEANDGPHHLHGASGSLSRLHWEAVGSVHSDRLTLRCVSPAGAAGYPGSLETTVTYTLSGLQLRIELEARVSAEMPVNLTQHSYFDLTGGRAGAAGHRLRVDSREALVTEGMIPTGRRAPVSGEVPLAHGLDQTYVLGPTRKAILETQDLRLTAHTNQDCFHVFVGGPNAEDLPGKHGAPYGPASGICLENQGYPDAPNHPEFPNTLLKPGQTYVNWVTLDFEELPA